MFERLSLPIGATKNKIQSLSIKLTIDGEEGKLIDEI